MTTPATDPGLDLLRRRLDEARALLAEHRTGDAIAAFREMAERWPGLEEIYPVLCQVHLAAGRVDLEPAWVERAVARDPAILDALLEAVAWFRATGRPRQADILLEAVARVAPGRARLDRACGTDSTPDAGSPERVSSGPVVPDEAVSVEVVPLVRRGPVREFDVHLRTEREADDVVLSVDVYPLRDPGHPARHHGYWNRALTLRRGETTTVRVAWDWASRAVTFDGASAGDRWAGPLDVDGEMAIVFVVYRGGRPVARTHVEQAVGPPRLESAVWFLTWKCNFKCTYCWEVQRIAKGELKPDPFRPWEEWTEAWNRQKPGILDITGGEPFLQPGFLEMIEALDDRIRIAITTNLSFDLTRFVQRIRPAKVFSMTLSLHPSQRMTFEQFLGRALLLANRGFFLTVNYVAWPEQLWLIPHYKERIEREGLRFHVDPYAATPHHPFEFTEKEKAFLRPFVGEDRAAHWYGEVDRAPVLCSGGLDHLSVQPNGDAFRCIGDHVWGKPKVGSLFDPEFRLNDSWTPCGDYWRCPSCDRDKVQVERIQR